MLASVERRIGSLVTILRRHAERHGCDVRYGCDQFLDRVVRGHAFHRTVAASRRNEVEIRIGGNGWKMLVANDFADADDGKLDG